MSDQTDNYFKNSISIFKNDYKTEGSNQPDMRGTVELSPEIIKQLQDTGSYQLDVSLWKKVGKSTGKAFLGGQVQLPYKVRKDEVTPDPKPNPNKEVVKDINDFEDEIPFN